MDLKIRLIFLFSFVLTVSSREIEIEYFRPDPKVNSTGFFDYGTLRLKRESKNHYSISGEFEVFENCGNEKEFLMEVKDKAGKITIMKTQDKLCNFFKNEKLVIPDIIKKSNVPKDYPCPMPKGKYWMKDVMIDEKKFSMVPPGEYIGRGSAIQNNKVLAAIEVLCRVIP